MFFFSLHLFLSCSVPSIHNYCVSKYNLHIAHNTIFFISIQQMMKKTKIISKILISVSIIFQNVDCHLVLSLHLLVFAFFFFIVKTKAIQMLCNDMLRSCVHFDISVFPSFFFTFYIPRQQTFTQIHICVTAWKSTKPNPENVKKE